MKLDSSPFVQALLDAPRQSLLWVVKGYRLLLKPWLGNACRFEPTCSQYALTALERHGAIAGATLAAGRLLRCHPWCSGGCDEVPVQAPAIFSRLGLTDRPRSAEPAPLNRSPEPSPLSPQEPSP
jgi:putative membrane protein insertion efficiency factor